MVFSLTKYQVEPISQHPFVVEQMLLLVTTAVVIGINTPLFQLNIFPTLYLY